MTGPQDVQAAVAEVAAARCCRHPVRLGATTVDGRTGELAERTVLVACKDRRALLCPACAATYQADAWQLVAAGLRGGKGVPEAVAGHPACFVTLTAPSFGPVHVAGRLCHPRRVTARCPHGTALDCRARHADDDPLAGRPLCPACFDYEGAVLWNARVSSLWQRTSVAVARELGRAAGVPAGALPSVFRLSYVKVVEFQRRGLVHLHVVVRGDGPEGPEATPPEWLTADMLGAAVERAVARASVPGIPGVSGDAVWGRERDVRVLGDGDPEAVAAYLAKYATKTASEDVALARRMDGRRQPVLAGADPHLAALARAAWELGRRPALEALPLRAHAHTFGYAGHFATKSRRYSTTFGALRSARAAHVRELDEAAEPLSGTWRYAGRGYGSPAAERLAEALAEGITGRPRRCPPDRPRAGELGERA